MTNLIDILKNPPIKYGKINYRIDYPLWASQIKALDGQEIIDALIKMKNIKDEYRQVCIVLVRNITQAKQNVEKL